MRRFAFPDCSEQHMVRLQDRVNSMLNGPSRQSGACRLPPVTAADLLRQG